MKYCLPLLILVVFNSCTWTDLKEPAAGKEKPSIVADSAQMIVDRAITAHGGDIINNSLIEFDFRLYHYKATRRGASFTYERIFQDSTGRHIRDILTNANFQREINGTLVSLSSKDSAAYSNSVNSVIYFALLPYFLNDRAARKTYLGISTIKGQPYYKISVTFGAEGGGKDFQDEYAYWFNRDQGTMDYLAYNYQVDGGGARFREAFHAQTINGVRFVDYHNFKPKSDSRDVRTFDQLFENGEMEKVSEIENIKIKVHPLPQ